ncbi:MAG TPA: hypothetical protein VMW08_02855 [Acidimicrobiales bacterium]|nr:hypothetical protein [Acidimicrobiales bacterium]
MSLQLSRIVLSGEADTWSDAGFIVSDDATLRIGTTVLELIDDADRPGIVTLHLDGLTAIDDVDGLPLRHSDSPAIAADDLLVHPNGVIAIDHVVVLTPELDRTADALAAAGFELRRRRDAERDGHEVHQLFYWLGDVILEVVEDQRIASDAPASVWGLALTVGDLDVTAAVLGPLMSDPRAAVQPDRRIASLRRDAGLSVPIAFMTPHVSAD